MVLDTTPVPGKKSIMLKYQQDRAWENWHRHVDIHAVQYCNSPYNFHATYAFPPQNMQYRPPRTAYCLENTHGHADNVRMDINGRVIGSGYHHVHGPGMAAQYYCGAGQYYHNSAVGRPYSAALGHHLGRHGFELSYKTPRNRMFRGDDCDALYNCKYLDHSDELDGGGDRGDHDNLDVLDDHDDDVDSDKLNDLDLVPVKGAVADIVKATKQGVSKGVALAKKGAAKVVLAAKLHVDPEHTDHHPGLWKEYLENPNYTHDVESARPGAQKEDVTSYVLHVLYFHEGRVFDGYLRNDQYGFKKWGNPRVPKKITITLQALDPKVLHFIKKKNVKVCVARDTTMPKEALSRNVLFECFPTGMSHEEGSKFQKSSFANQEKQWIKMHPGRVHECKTFANFDKEEAEHEKQVDLGLKKSSDELEVT